MAEKGLNLGVPSDSLLFELTHGDHVWRLYADGRIEGFPDGTTVFNMAAPVIAALQAMSRSRHIADIMQAHRGGND